LSERGIAPGDRLEVLERQPFGGPLFVNFAGREHTIGGMLARAMRVELDRVPGGAGAARSRRSTIGGARPSAGADSGASASAEVGAR
jgi:hypothetical protein